MRLRPVSLTAVIVPMLLAPHTIAAQTLLDSGVRVTVSSRQSAVAGLGADGISRFNSAATDRLGRFYFVDANTNQLLAFDSSGALLTQVGGAGEERGKFRVARSVTVDDDGAVLVLDPALKRVTSFRWARGALAVQDTVTVSAPGVAMCAMRGQLYLYGFRDGHMVHVFDRAGRRLRSFGEPFLPGSRLLQIHYADGPLLCDRAREQVVVTSRLLLRLRAYSTAGEMRWDRAVEGLPRTQVVESSPGVVDLRALDPATVTLTSAVLVEPNALLIALRSGRLGDDALVHARLLDPSGGRVIGSRSALPEVVAAAGTRVATISRWERSVPRLAAISLGGR